jgi:hypothetical protein
MHVIEYYFYVNWNILIEVWNISYKYYVSLVLVNEFYVNFSLKCTK